MTTRISVVITHIAILDFTISQDFADGFAVLDEGLMSSGKLDGIEITPKAFLYSPNQSSFLLLSKEKSSIPMPIPIPVAAIGLDGTGKRGQAGSKLLTQSLVPSSSSSVQSTGTTTVTGTAAATGGGGTGLGQNIRVRPQGGAELSQSSTNPSYPTSPSHKVLSPADTPVGHGKPLTRSVIENQIAGGILPPYKSTQIFGSSISVLPLSVYHPEDSLEMLGATLDLHQMEGDRERGMYRVEGDDKYGNDTYDEMDPGDDVSSEDEVQRDSIAMSSRPFRVGFIFASSENLIISLPLLLSHILMAT